MKYEEELKKLVPKTEVYKKLYRKKAALQTRMKKRQIKRHAKNMPVSDDLPLAKNMHLAWDEKRYAQMVEALAEALTEVDDKTNLNQLISKLQ